MTALVVFDEYTIYYRGVLSLETLEPDKKHAKELSELQTYAVQRWEVHFPTNFPVY